MSDQILTVPIDQSTHELLQNLAAHSNTTITAVLEQAVRDLHRKQFWAEFNAQCVAIQADPVAWSDLRRDDATWDQANADGLTAD